MDRGLIFPGQIPLETDLLFAQKASMVGLAKLAAAILGTSTMVNGFATTQTTVPSLGVSVAAGEIYQLANIDGTAYSSIAADTTHQILKQGVALDATTLAITPPGTAGFSINYLIQATFAEVDGTPVVLPYYNASNPSTAYSGPANAGTTNNTRRAGTVVLTAKAGTAATTGSQTTPAPDANNVGLYVVTVANGAATVVNANISAYASAPFINTGMLGQVATLLNTPAQFDNSLKAATTAFVKSQGMQSNGMTAVTSTVALAVSDVGKSFVVQGAGGYNVTLPDVSTVPSGARIEIFGGAAATLLPFGSQVFYTGFATGVTVSSLALTASDSITLVAAPGASTPGWFISGELQLQYSSQFAQSKGANGYYKTPGGMIVNYGITTTSGSADVTVTFPLAFPNACRSIVTTYVNGTISGNTIASIGAYGLTNFAVGGWNAATGTRGAVSVFWIAEGY